jgi:hypothetical protein
VLGGLITPDDQLLRLAQESNAAHVADREMTIGRWFSAGTTTRAR